VTTASGLEYDIITTYDEARDKLSSEGGTLLGGPCRGFSIKKLASWVAGVVLFKEGKAVRINYCPAPETSKRP